MKKLIVILAAVLVLMCGCAGGGTEISEKELAAVNDICETAYSAGDLEDVTDEFLADGRDKKFEALKNIYKLPNGYYAFFAKPVGYNGEISMAVVLDGEKTVSVRILEHSETDHYVRNFDTGEWFISRLEGKAVSEYLEVVKLTAAKANEVVAITGSTMTTQAVVNGVNSAFGAYTETILGGTAEAVDYMVDASDYDRGGLH